ncbi:MAG: hypothetical protein OSA51_02675 [Octadecabacter sp.]|nr:hypothetical protein [Octadecabacter sp.]
MRCFALVSTVPALILNTNGLAEPTTMAMLFALLNAQPPKLWISCILPS